jgi:hypothetical protein
MNWLPVVLKIKFIQSCADGPIVFIDTTLA